MKDSTGVAEAKGNLFQMNYLKYYQFKADTVASKIDRYESLMDEIQLFRHAIVEIRNDGDGLTRDERDTINLYQHTIEKDLNVIDRMPDVSALHDRLDFLENRIERHADMWGIDSW